MSTKPDQAQSDRFEFQGDTFLCDTSGIRRDDRFLPFLCTDDSRFELASNHGGAINEAFSDSFGTSVEFFFQESGSGPLKADYLIGEDIPEVGAILRGQPGPIRSMESPQSLRVDPTSTVRFPDHFSQRLRFVIVIVEGTRASPTLLDISPVMFIDGDSFVLSGTDSGAVHWNSTILSHASHLAIEGGRNRTSGLTVQGVGGANREQIEQAFFRAMTDMMPSSPTISLAALITFQSAVDLFGSNSAAATAVAEAMVAVGLLVFV